MKIAIVGAGWYGCHIARELVRRGVECAVFERHGDVMQEASAVNQSRLHLGFHYPRSHITRVQSIRGFRQFLQEYPSLSGPVESNVYGVCNRHSMLDFETYSFIMRASGLDFEIVNPARYGVRNVEGAMLCPERHLKLNEAKKLFTSELKDVLRLATPVAKLVEEGEGYRIEGEHFTHVIDATWSQLTPAPIPVYYEPAMLLLYRCKASPLTPAVTVMDGDLYSIYPFDDHGVYTLSGVSETSLGKYGSAADAWARIRTLDPAEVERLRRLMETGMAWYYPAFCEEFTYLRPIMAVKTKPVVRSDDRACYVRREGNLFSVLSGKIDTIFEASSIILESLGISQPEPVS